uniref:ADAM17_MPD domain-containing protein n=1 Tax=Macrostomum lignano TaxID=282301 RepID=A0A1I8ILA2_9PLAT
CESVCSRLGPGFKPCACDSEEHACRVCCRDEAGGNCTVYRQGGDSVLMPANQPCQQGADHLQGRCDGNGTCQELASGSGSSLCASTFLWKNIVFTVVILSLLLWVPACAIIAYQDRIDARKSGDSEADAADIRYSAARPGGSAQGRYFT